VDITVVGEVTMVTVVTTDRVVVGVVTSVGVEATTGRRPFSPSWTRPLRPSSRAWPSGETFFKFFQRIQKLVTLIKRKIG
jgi:hypothetical protein